MTCPPDIADVLTEILRLGILRIRGLAHQKDARRIIHESDHIHNLPGLLNNYAPQLLEFYWRVERPLLIEQISEAECLAFQPAWDRLQSMVARENSKAQSATPLSASSATKISADPIHR